MAYRLYATVRPFVLNGKIPQNFIPMEYTPTPQSFVIEPITTANKNIQSFFMRTDQSYYVPEAQRLPLHASSHPPLTILVDNSEIRVMNRCIPSDIFKQNQYNTERYGSIERCRDILYKIISSEVKEALEDFQSMPADDGDSAQKKIKLNDAAEDNGMCDAAENMNDGAKCMNEVPECIAPRDLFVQLIFCDFFGRSDIISIVDVLINQIGFMGIMLLPCSLSASFALNQNYCAIVYPKGFSFIDDFMLADSFMHVPGADSPVLVDDEDFVEEFSRLKSLDESLRYSCNDCEHKDSTRERIEAHVKKEHGEEGSFFLYADSPVPRESFDNRIKYLFGKEKAEKIAGHVYSVDTEFEGATPLSDYHALAIRGAALFNALECSKECWMTDKEWQAVRLRALKEKLLFFI